MKKKMNLKIGPCLKTTATSTPAVFLKTRLINNKMRSDRDRHKNLRRRKPWRKKRLSNRTKNEFI
jgi:hypothetical protein